MTVRLPWRDLGVQLSSKPNEQGAQGSGLATHHQRFAIAPI